MKDYTDISGLTIKPGMTVAFDCDFTLIFADSKNGVNGFRLNKKVYDLYCTFKAMGCKMIVWSSGGNDYAKSVSDTFGLDAMIIDKFSIMPDIAVDDDWPASHGGTDYGKIHICCGVLPDDMKLDLDDMFVD